MRHTKAFDAQARRQNQRCAWCQRIIPMELMTRDHIWTRHNGQRERNGSAYLLACEPCNAARCGLTIGSLRFEKWLRRVMAGRIERYKR